MTRESGGKIELLEVVEVDAAKLLLLVPSPVLGEITVGDDAAQAQELRRPVGCQKSV
jgi:hypothetical protein